VGVCVQGWLSSAYSSVNDIDGWLGGLAEDHLPGASVGPLFKNILVEQFTRLRDGEQQGRDMLRIMGNWNRWDDSTLVGWSMMMVLVLRLVYVCVLWGPGFVC
jgi:hypothetical protein